MRPVLKTQRGQPVIFGGCNGGEEWIPQKIGYFDFFYDQNTRVIGCFMEHVGKIFNFRHIHMLINRVNNKIII